jgi:hypothetical protein
MVRSPKLKSELPLKIYQGAFYLRPAILDSYCWPMDPLENSASPRYSWLGMANKTRSTCWVCFNPSLFVPT